MSTADCSGKRGFPGKMRKDKKTENGPDCRKILTNREKTENGEMSQVLTTSALLAVAIRVGD